MPRRGRTASPPPAQRSPRRTRPPTPPRTAPPAYGHPPQRSMFRDAAAIAGGVTVGTAVGHVAGEAISSLFSGPRGREVQDRLPQNYEIGQEPSGPCAYQISQFLQCASSADNMEACSNANKALQECKKNNGIP